MTALDQDAALAVLDVAKEHARLLRRGVDVALPKRRRLRVIYTPDMSYGRLNSPHVGNAEFEYAYSVWSPAASREDTFLVYLASEHRGWRGLHGGETEALALLMGQEPDDALNEGKTLAERFTR